MYRYIRDKLDRPCSNREGRGLFMGNISEKLDRGQKDPPTVYERQREKLRAAYSKGITQNNYLVKLECQKSRPNFVQSIQKQAKNAPYLIKHKYFCKSFASYLQKLGIFAMK